MKRKLTFIFLLGTLLIGGIHSEAKTTKKSSSRATHSSKKKSSTTTSASSKGTDLAIFNVQGKVKSVTYHVDRNYCAPSPFYYSKPILFSETGDCTNIKEILKVTFDCNRKVTIERNKLGQLECIHNINEFGDEGGTVSFEWSNDRVSQFVDYDGSMNAENTMYLTYSDGRIFRMEGGGSMDGLYHETTVTFSDFVEDSHGNWTQCKMSVHQIEGDSDEIYDARDLTLNIKRTISYYE